MAQILLLVKRRLRKTKAVDGVNLGLYSVLDGLIVASFG
jgi:hypothetical protein